MSTTSVKKVRRVEQIYLRVKDCLQQNRLTQHYFPPSGEVSTTLTLILTTLSIFLAARTVLGPIADVGGSLFALLVLILLALIGGKLVHGFHWMFMHFCHVDIHLPPLLGMLVVGILLKNIPYSPGRTDCSLEDKNITRHLENMTSQREGIMWAEEESEMDLLDRVSRSVEAHTEEEEVASDDCQPRYIGQDLDPHISRTLRSICLTVILLMAGLELDPVQLKKLSAMVIRATFIPCFVEATAVAVFSHLILGFPWTVGFMLGFVLAAVSPAVIIPCLMSLSQRGFGVAKGIPTLVIAACSADDVVAISGFGIFMGLTFSAGAPLWQLVLHGPIEVVIGVSFGVGWGLLAQWIPNQDHHHVAFFRWLILTGGGLIALFGAHKIHYDGAGGLATIIMAFVASIEWRKEGWDEHNPVIKTFQRMWIILEPIIFALIGTEIQMDKINPETLGKSIGVLVLALLLRMVGTYLAVCWGDLNKKEKLFMAFAWMPKATVQAALGPIFLAKVLELGEEEWETLGNKEEWVGMGNDILTIAVLSILITAPLGSVLILALGSRLLETDKKEVQGEKEKEGQVVGHVEDLEEGDIDSSKKEVVWFSSDAA